MQLSRVLLRIFQFSLGGSLLLLILSGVFWWWVPNVSILVLFGFLVTGHAFIAYLCARLRDTHKWRWWMMSGIAGAGVSLMICAWVFMTLEPNAFLESWFLGVDHGEAIGVKAGMGIGLEIPILGWVLFAGIVGMMMGMRLSSRWARGIRFLTITAGGATILFAVGGSWFLHWMSGHTPWYDMYQWSGLVLGIGSVPAVAFGCGTLGCLMGSVLDRVVENEAPEGVRKVFTMHCPRCAEQQTMKTHGDHCASCGLQVKVIPQ